MTSPKSELGPEETAALLLNVSMLFMKKLSALMRQSELKMDPAQGGVLMRISESPCRMSDLAQHQHVQPPTISRSVGRLVERGLVERWIPDDNRRITMVRLTSAGRRFVSALKQQALSNTEQLLSELNPSDRKIVQQGLQQLQRALLSADESG